MNLTEQQLKNVAHIPTSEVEQDLADAKVELKSYTDELDAINARGRLPQDKVRAYMLEGKIAKGREFIDELNQIITFRNTGHSRI